MLFDLRGRGRRRTVQAVYLTLALLLGGGLVLFGVGGAGGGGLLDAFNNDDGQSVSDITRERLDRAERNAQLKPSDAATIAALARARFQAADFDQNTGAFTAAGKVTLAGADRAWQKYLTLIGNREPDSSLANLMVQAYSAQGLNQPAKAVSAMEDVIAAREDPTPALYLQLAQYAYAADQTRKAELAGQAAIDAASADDKEQVKALFEQIKAAATGSSTATSTATTTTPATTGAATTP